MLPLARSFVRSFVGRFFSFLSLALFNSSGQKKVHFRSLLLLQCSLCYAILLLGNERKEIKLDIVIIVTIVIVCDFRVFTANNQIITIKSVLNRLLQ